MKALPSDKDPARAVNLADVAALAGVSLATASRAMADCRGVRAATRERVLKAAGQLAYCPNIASQQLAGARWHSLAGARIQARIGYLFHHQIKADDLALAQAQASEQGLEIEGAVIDDGDDCEKSRVLQGLAQRNVQGLLIRSDQGAFPELPAELVADFRLVMVGDHPAYHGVTCVAPDFFRLVQTFCEQLFASDHRRIGFWLIDDRRTISHQHAIGAVLAMQRQHSPQRHLVLLTSLPGCEYTDSERLVQWIRDENLEACIVPSTEHHKRLAPLIERPLTWAAMWGSEENVDCMTPGFDVARLQRQALIIICDHLRRQTSNIRGERVLLAPRVRNRANIRN